MRANRTQCKRTDDILNVVALVKPDGEVYYFIYDDASRAEMLRTLGRFASAPELSFSWDDATVMADKVRHYRRHESHE